MAASLEKCNDRSKAQQLVLEATGGWHEGLEGPSKLMQANVEHRAGSPSQAQSAWLKAVSCGAQEHQRVQKGNCQFDAPSPLSHGAPAQNVGVDL